MRKKKQKPAFTYKVPSPQDMLKLADQYRDQHNEEPPDNFFDIMEKTTRDVQKEMYDFNINQHRKKLRQLQKEFMGGKNAKSV